MKKRWVRESDFNYTFLVDEKKVGKMEVHFNKNQSKAICTMGKKIFEIKRSGFWSSNLEIIDNDEGVILKAYPEKWYANTSTVEYKSKKYKLIVRNNPLAEFAITENGKDILAYGLALENKKVKISILTSIESDFVFDCLLWYLFLPIANENIGMGKPELL
jgi:hypothetical protein